MKITRCGRCNRKLTKLESVVRGYGDVCFKKITARRQTDLEEFEYADDE